MSPTLCRPHTRLLGVAAAAALLTLGNPVLAAPVTYGNITLDAEYSLGGGSTVDGMTDPEASIYIPTPPSAGADYYLFKTVDGNNVFFHTYGLTGGSTYFGARASGEGHFSALTRASFSGSFVATQAAPTFNYFVDYGEVGLTGEGTGVADLLLEIRLNGVAIARDQTTITRNNTGTTCSDNGNGLGTLADYINCSSGDSSSAFGSGGAFSQLLDGIAAGETFTLDYDIIATVSGNLSAGTIDCDPYGGYGGDPYGGVATQSFCQVPGTGIARSGDPFDFGGASPQPGTPGDLSFVGAAAASVPEPGSLALVGLALAGTAALRRRRPEEPEAKAD